MEALYFFKFFVGKNLLFRFWAGTVGPPESPAVCLRTAYFSGRGLVLGRAYKYVLKICKFKLRYHSCSSVRSAFQSVGSPVGSGYCMCIF